MTECDNYILHQKKNMEYHTAKDLGMWSLVFALTEKYLATLLFRLLVYHFDYIAVVAIY